MTKTVDLGGGVLLERRVPCRLADGVTLYADHYRPAGRTRRPTLLMRQPYGRDIASTVVYAHPAWFARQGYNVVIQDVRGRGDSEGEFYPFRHEGRDGAETIAAIRDRPEANGRVGMYGFSYQGMTQLLAAAEQPDGLECIAPAMTAHDLYYGWFYNQGALRLASTLGWGIQMLTADVRRLGLEQAGAHLESAWSDLPAQYRAAPFGHHPAIQGEGVPCYVSDWLRHDIPGEYWSSMDVSRTSPRIDVPGLHLSGWYDTYLQGSVAGYLALCSGAASEHARRHQYLLAGPWVHIPWGDRIGTAVLGEEAAFDTDALLLRWFDHWLRDAGSFAEEPRIRHFAMGEGKWRAADEFAPASDAFYLRSAGRANSSKGDGSLSNERAGSEPPDIFVYDPEVAVTGPGGMSNVAGPLSQTLLELGNNVLTYTSETVVKSLHIFGLPRVEIYCATSASAADLVAKLVCVRTDGEATFICIGIGRSTHLFGASYSCDQTFLWAFSLEPTSWVFAPGERIRLEIASSAFPLYDRNPGTGIAPRLAGPSVWRRSTQVIYHDSAHPSVIYLPTIEQSEVRR